MLSLLINTAGSHTTCGFLITPTAPLKRDNLQQKMPATKGTLQNNAKYTEIESAKGAKRNDLKKKERKKIALTTRTKTKVPIAVKFVVDRVNVGCKSPSDNEN